MKPYFRKVFSPLLNIFEGGEDPYLYKSSHRTILVVMGVLFLLLSLGLAWLGFHFAQSGALIPFLVFFCVALTSIVVGTLGTDRAVSKIWNSK